MGGRYFITGVQLGMISALVELGMDVCDVLKDIEGAQFIGNMPEPYEDYEIAIVPRRTAAVAPDVAERGAFFIELKCNKCGAIVDASLIQTPCRRG